MFEEKEIALGDRRAKLVQLGAADARHVARRLVAILGEGIKATGGDGSADVRMQAAIGAVLSSVDDATLDWLTEVYARQTKIERTAGEAHFIALDKQTQDALFGGGHGLVLWLEWLQACIEFSVGDFFRAAGGVLAKHLPTPADPSSASPSTSTGSSTGSPRPKGIGRVSMKSAQGGL